VIKLFTKTLQFTKISEGDIIKVLKETKSDKQIIEKLAKLNDEHQEPYSEEINIKRGFGKWRIIKPVVKQRGLSIKGVLDYGGNVGDIAYAVGKKALHLNKKQIFVIDIDEFAGIKWTARKDITFIHFDNIDKMPKNSVDLIMANHTLHHIDSEYYEQIIDVFDKALSKNGIIVLYEHDCSHKNMKPIIDLEHCLYDTVVSKKMSYGEFTKTFYAKYLSIKKWEKIFSKHFKSFKLVEKRNIDNSFYLFLERV
jgi:hypothetical protein